MTHEELFIGIDIGTSGCRAIAIDGDGRERANAHVSLPEPRREGARVEQDPEVWWGAMQESLRLLLSQIDAKRVRAIAVDGTSGTLFLTDAEGRPLGPALMYNDGRATQEAERIARAAPAESAAHGASSGLAKLLWLLPRTPDARAAHTPGDWIAGRLLGRFGLCDANSALKLGYDPISRCWPAWLDSLGVPSMLLPQVVPPGTPLGPLAPDRVREFGLPSSTLLVAGTTDSTAAIVATGISHVGEAVTSLGSTLVTKVLAARPLFAPKYGVYSQPFGDAWLVGGGSNSGGAVLRRFFTDEEMARLEQRLNPDQPTGLDYYPLLAPGERFPINDPTLAPRLHPRPREDAVFFQGMIEGMAQIEARAYRLLAELGTPYPTTVRSVGGGAHNAAWTRIRSALLQVPVLPAEKTEAAFGSALLARGGSQSR